MASLEKASEKARESSEKLAESRKRIDRLGMGSPYFDSIRSRYTGGIVLTPKESDELSQMVSRVVGED